MTNESNSAGGGPKKSPAVLIAVIVVAAFLGCCCIGGVCGGAWALVEETDRGGRRGPGFEPFRFDQPPKK
jgi:hypothetical protein